MNILKRKKTDQPQGRAVRDQNSRSAPVFSYYAKRAADSGLKERTHQSELARTSHRSFWLTYFPSILSLLFVVAALGYLTTLSTTPRVTTLSNPNELLVIQPNEVYETAASELLDDSLLNQSKLTINTIRIAEQLQAQFPELGDVVVTIPLIGRRPIIQTKPAAPSLVLTGAGGSFVIDKNGVPVLKANQLASLVRDKLPVVSDVSDANIELGKQILTTDLVSFITVLQAQFASKNIEVESYTFPALSNELHVRLTGKGYYIKFNTESDPRQQLGTYIAAQERLDAENKTPTEYIDVRVEERAYIK